MPEKQNAIQRITVIEERTKVSHEHNCLKLTIIPWEHYEEKNWSERMKI